MKSQLTMDAVIQSSFKEAEAEVEEEAEGGGGERRRGQWFDDKKRQKNEGGMEGRGESTGMRIEKSRIISQCKTKLT